MNDRFKFRVWDKYNEVYFGGSYGVSYYLTDSEIDGDLYCFQCDGPFELSKDDEFVIEQCTGLKDKNGKLIYEGDFLYYKGEVCLVFWSEPTACFGVMLQDSGYTDYAGDIKRSDLYSIDAEIIGNIHENPKLLKESK